MGSWLDLPCEVCSKGRTRYRWALHHDFSATESLHRFHSLYISFPLVATVVIPCPVYKVPHYIAIIIKYSISILVWKIVWSETFDVLSACCVTLRTAIINTNSSGTRKHSSRMRTAHTCFGDEHWVLVLVGGGRYACPPGILTPWNWPGTRDTYFPLSWTEWLTDASDNITFPQILLRAVKNLKFTTRNGLTTGYCMLDLTTGAVGPPMRAARRVACRFPGFRAAVAAPASRLLALFTGDPLVSYRLTFGFVATDAPLEGAVTLLTFDPTVDGIDSAIWNRIRFFFIIWGH